MLLAPRRLLALAIGSILALGLAEGVARVVTPNSRSPVGRQGILRQLAPTDDDHRIYDMHPGRERSVWGTTVRTNRHGFRDRDYAAQKPEGVRRIVAMGDSITFGTGLPTEDTWPEQLEQLCVEGGAAVEVLNAGVEGYDLRDSLERLEHQALAFDPDIVVYAYCINDIGTATVQLPYLARSPLLRRLEGSALLGAYWRWRERGRAEELEELSREREAAIPRSSLEGDEVALARLAALAEALPEGRPPKNTRRLCKTLAWYTERERIERLRWGLERLADLAEREGVEVQVVLIPALRELDPWCSREAWSLAYAMVQHEAERAGLAFESLARPFRREGLTGLRQERTDDIHPTALGNGMIAEVVRDALNARGLLAP